MELSDTGPKNGQHQPMQIFDDGNCAGFDHDKEEWERISRLGTGALTGAVGAQQGSHYARIQVAASTPCLLVCFCNSTLTFHITFFISWH